MLALRRSVSSPLRSFLVKDPLVQVLLSGVFVALQRNERFAVLAKTVLDQIRGSLAFLGNHFHVEDQRTPFPIHSRARCVVGIVLDDLMFTVGD